MQIRKNAKLENADGKIQIWKCANLEKYKFGKMKTWRNEIRKMHIWKMKIRKNAKFPKCKF